MDRFINFLAGCVVGAALIATGMVLSKWGRPAEELQVSLLKDNSAAMVWAVDRASGRARFVSIAPVPYDAVRQATREQARQLGEMLASGNVIEHAASDFFGGMAEGAMQAPRQPRR